MAQQARQAIRSGCGYWLVDDYPIGKYFRRTPYDGPLVWLKDVTGPVDSIKGKMLLATIEAGVKIAVSPDVVI